MGGGQKQPSATAINEINLQQSSSAAVLPIVYGTTRVPVNVIDYGDFVAIPQSSNSNSGGKGGGAPSTTSYTYQAYIALGLCEGQIAGIGTIWRAKDKFVTDGGGSSLSKIGMTLFTGAEGQAAWGYLTTNHPDKAMGYSGTAYVAASAYPLDTSAGLPNHNFEVQGKLIYGGGIVDANPAVIIPDYLTASRYGIAFPSASLGSLTQYSNYCVAMGLFVSPALSSAQAASQSLDDLMLVTNSAIVWSEGVLKITPYGDQAVTGNGVTFTPNVTPIYNLTDDDFLPNGDNPVQLARASPADQYNSFKMEILDRANDYNKVVIGTQDQAAIDRYSLREANQITANMICTPAIGRLSIELYKQRTLYVLNQYQFILGWKYALLEPMDIVTITDAALGLNQWPVRILSVEESDTQELTFTVEDFPAGAGHAALYASSSSAGYLADFNASPGDVAQPMFIELPKNYSSTGLAIGVAVGGAASNWGGCEVWSSTDGTTYKLLGTCRGGARYGSLTASLADSGGTAAIALAGQGGQILASSANDAALLNSLCAIDSEFLTYQTATLTGTNAYSLGTLGRGLSGSLAAAHSTSAPFARLDQAIIQSGDLSLAYVGQTLYFKFLSFNVYGGGKQSLADVSAYTYIVTGVQALSAAAGPTGLAAACTSAGVGLSWTMPIAGGNLTTVVERAPDVSGLAGTFVGIASVPGGLAGYTDPKTDGSIQHYRVRCVDDSGIFTAYSSQVVITCTAGNSGSTSASLSISFSPSAPYKYATVNAHIAVTATPSGGTAPYTYVWAHVSGDTLTKTNTTSATCTFKNSVGDTDHIEIVSCTVTDSAGTPASTTVNVEVECVNDSSGTSPPYQ